MSVEPQSKLYVQNIRTVHNAHVSDLIQPPESLEVEEFKTSSAEENPEGSTQEMVIGKTT